MEDLKYYSAKRAKVLEGKFNGYNIHTLNLPSYGSITIQMLQIFDNLVINNEKDWSIKISSAIEESYKYRPYQKNVDSLKSILSINAARNIAGSIEKNTIVSYQNELKEYNYSDLAMQHTAHLTTSDKYGNVVSLTQTLGPNMGSRVATKGLGFLYNVTMGPYLGGISW